MILYYTGTGNSRYIAKRLSNILQDECVDLFNKLRAKDYDDICSDKPFVIVAPIYGWQLPHLLRDWLLKVKLTGNNDIYFVMSCGGEIGNCAKYLKKFCKDMNMSFKGCAEVVMPENYIAMFEAPHTEKALAIIEKAEPVIEKTAQIIERGERIPEKPVGLVDKFKSGIINDIFYRMMINSKKFKASEACIGCGKCARECVMSNITMVDKKPKWNDNCTHCMACICGCPANAIEYGKNSVGKPRYQCPKK